MLKVIKSNVLLALVLFLSIPAFAGQAPVAAATAPVKTGWMSMFAAKTGSMLSRARQAMPSWRSFNAKAYGKIAMARVMPATQAILAFAKQHSTALKGAALASTVCALGWAGYRKIKAILSNKHQLIPALQPIVEVEEADDLEFHDPQAYVNITDPLDEPEF